MLPSQLFSFGVFFATSAGMETHRRDYSARLRAALQARRMSHAELAAATDASQAAITNWLTRGSIPYRPTLNRVCAVLGIRSEWLVDGVGPKNAPKPNDELGRFPADVQADLAALGEAAMRSKDIRQTIAYLARVFSRDDG
jgi:transcriptional regulator with XRE-family HTH domain